MASFDPLTTIILTVMQAPHTVCWVPVMVTGLPEIGTYAALLLWGSPDPFNVVQFFSGQGGTGNSLGTFNGADLACFNTLCHDVGFDLVLFDTEASGEANIGSVVLSNSEGPAFEFAGPIQEPLPPALYSFGSALGGAFWLSRRKRSGISGLA